MDIAKQALAAHTQESSRILRLNHDSLGSTHVAALEDEVQ